MSVASLKNLYVKHCISAGQHMAQQNSMPDIWWGSREYSSQVHSLENAEDVHDYVIQAKHMMDVRGGDQISLKDSWQKQTVFL